MPSLQELLDFSTRLHQENSEVVNSCSFHPKWDPELIDHILGKDDATLMKEAMNVITDSDQSLENRKIAFENLEMLIENIYNAKNLSNMNMWESLIQQLSSSEPIIRMHAASVCGTAVQNNIDSQKCFLDNGGLKKVLSLFDSDDDINVRLKAFYAIANEVRNNFSALEEFCKYDGWAIIMKYLKDDNYSKIQRRILFFIRSLLLQDIGVDVVIESIKLSQLQKVLIHVIQREIVDDAFENALKSISLLYEKSCSIFDTKELMSIRNVIKSIKEGENFDVISKDDIDEISIQFNII